MIAESFSSSVIGVFDSGVGGLTVVRRIWDMLPHEPVVFVADQAHVPYGGRPLSQVAWFARNISAALIRDARAKAVVMACNISTATALGTVRRNHADNVVLGVIAPGASAAIQYSSTSSIGVLATQGTVCTGAYTRTLQMLDLERGRGREGETERRGDEQLKVTEMACPDFVPLIEAEQTESEEAFEAASRYLAPILRAGADVVILGCTHYPFLLPCLRQVAPHIRFIDPAEHTVCELSELLGPRCSGASFTEPVHTLYTTGDPVVFEQQVLFFLPKAAKQYIIKQAAWHGDQLHLSPAPGTQNPAPSPDCAQTLQAVGAPLAAPSVHE